MRNRIWLTYKSRIKSEERLLANEYWLELLLFYYSLSTVFVSVWLLAFDSNNQLANVTFTCFSIFILCLTLYVSAANYTQRAYRMKENYIALRSLLYHYDKNKYNDESIHHEYSRLLNSTENHQEIDFIRAIVDDYNGALDIRSLARIPTKQHCRTYRSYKAKKILLLTTLLLIPPILICMTFFGRFECLL